MRRTLRYAGAVRRRKLALLTLIFFALMTFIITWRWTSTVLPQVVPYEELNFPKIRTTCPLFRDRIVHFDLKGMPPKVDYFRQLFPFLRKLNATGILMEYEDMFPYTGELSVLARNDSYTIQDIHEICQIAKANKLELIPLIPTFGNMEFVLKHKKFSHMREKKDPSTICPSNAESAELISKMLRQVHRVHSKVLHLKTVHIGMNLATYGKDSRCKERIIYDLYGNYERLRLEHLSK
uniref:Beta-N-acetylhexosaminidase n=1 Tax=Steinernema glaseri TaxID=37863 RepID=A0A1I7ZM26_9BILA